MADAFDIALFTRSYEAPDAKSRLANEIGIELALGCHRELLSLTIRAVQGFATIAYVEGEVGDTCWLAGLPYRNQGKGDLGQRMLLCFKEGIRVLVGSDCPLMSSAYVNEALVNLRNYDVVLGPAEDGGYVLIGMNEPHACLFNNVPWGSDQVLNRTLEKSASLNLHVALLPTVWDIDSKKDYERWRNLQKSNLDGN